MEEERKPMADGQVRSNKGRNQKLKVAWPLLNEGGRPNLQLLRSHFLLGICSHKGNLDGNETGLGKFREDNTVIDYFF